MDNSDNARSFPNDFFNAYIHTALKKCPHSLDLDHISYHTHETLLVQNLRIFHHLSPSVFPNIVPIIYVPFPYKHTHTHIKGKELGYSYILSIFRGRIKRNHWKETTKIKVKLYKKTVANTKIRKNLQIFFRWLIIKQNFIQIWALANLIY